MWYIYIYTCTHPTCIAVYWSYDISLDSNINTKPATTLNCYYLSFICTPDINLLILGNHTQLSHSEGLRSRVG